MSPTPMARTFMRGTGAMPIESAFRLSSYLALALSCACLAYAEMPFLPALPYFLVPVGLLLLLAFFLEGRWSLPVRSANALAVLIAMGAAVRVKHLDDLRSQRG